MLSWLVGYTLASMAAAFIIVRIFDYIFAEVSGSLIHVAKLGLFVVTWVAITMKAGMHGFTKKVRQLRQGSTSVSARIDALTKSERQ